MVTGQPPFPGKDVDVVLQAHLKKELTPPDHLNTNLSSGLGEVVEFMMAKDRKDRYRKPDDLIIDLECLLNGNPPKLARDRIAGATLEDLAEGEVVDARPKGIFTARKRFGSAALGVGLGLEPAAQSSVAC